MCHARPPPPPLTCVILFSLIFSFLNWRKWTSNCIWWRRHNHLVESSHTKITISWTSAEETAYGQYLPALFVVMSWRKNDDIKISNNEKITHFIFSHQSWLAWGCFTCKIVKIPTGHKERLLLWSIDNRQWMRWSTEEGRQRHYHMMNVHTAPSREV